MESSRRDAPRILHLCGWPRPFGRFEAPPERLVYTHYWLTDETPVETLITIELQEEGDATRVVMLHEGHLTEQSRDSHEEGWSSCFDRLEEMFA